MDTKTTTDEIISRQSHGEKITAESGKPAVFTANLPALSFS